MLDCVVMGKQLTKQTWAFENIVKKGENSGYQHFSALSTMFYFFLPDQS